MIILLSFVLLENHTQLLYFLYNRKMETKYEDCCTGWTGDNCSIGKLITYHTTIHAMQYLFILFTIDCIKRKSVQNKHTDCFEDFIAKTIY